VRAPAVSPRLSPGAGGVALRGALALDRERYEVTMITGGTGLTGERTPVGDRVLTGDEAALRPPAGDLLAEAYAAGLGVVRVPALVPQIAPRQDAAALRALTTLLAGGA